ncbi:PriA Primosomal protein N' (replication factor Y) - superfamily II helicase [Candidatus Nanopelagicaceae bacterium]
MALTRPLRLKSEIAKLKAEGSSSALPIARVWVDAGVFHLDQSYDYLIPDNLASLISIGIRIQVPFHGREVEAIVLSREIRSESPVLKPISKVISTQSVATKESLYLIASAAQRWAAHPFDIIRSAIPPRVASVDKEQWSGSDTEKVKSKAQRRYLHIPPVVNRFDYLASTIERLTKNGSTLVIVPDTRSVQRLLARIPQAIVLDSALERSERYRNFLKSRYGTSQIVIGTRSAVFAPIVDLSSLIVLDEGSELNYEVRSPGWNVRDVAILRAMKSDLNLTFVGYSPSSEVARLIENKWIEFSSAKSRVDVSAFPQSHGELIPSRLVSEIRKAMSSGPILFLAPRKGYAQAIVCAKCKNIALCECGGKLLKRSSQSLLECTICAKAHAEWRCTWCQGSTPYLMGRGSDRFAYEIGAAFPGLHIVQSTAEMLVESFEESKGLVIATPGAIPQTHNGYSLVVVLEAERFFMQADIRAHERARELFFSTAALASQAGRVALVMPIDHPIIGALSAWKPSLISQRELRERLEVNLPPFTRAVTLDISNSESQSLLRGLRKSQEEGRLPESTQLLGPSQLKGEIDRIVALTPLIDGEALIGLLHEFQRRRSSSKKALATIRIDPYSLSR